MLTRASNACALVRQALVTRIVNSVQRLTDTLNTLNTELQVR